MEVFNVVVCEFPEQLNYVISITDNSGMVYVNAKHYDEWIKLSSGD